MTHLNSNQLASLKLALESLKNDLEEAVKTASIQAKPVDLEQPFGRLSRMDAIQSQQMAKRQRKQFEIRLRQTEASLSAMQSSRYGICIRCREPITMDRLSARPEVPVCLTCQKDLESSS
jgi:DnaK suppressor protein